MRKKMDRHTSSTVGLLRPSLPNDSNSAADERFTTGGRTTGGRTDIADAALCPVFELQDDDRRGITALCFGQEHQHRAYVVLVVGFKPHYMHVFHVGRNEAEFGMLSDLAITTDDSTTANDPGFRATGIRLHTKLVGHERLITSIKFDSTYEDELITASIDKTVRLWDVQSGEQLRQLPHASPVTIAMCLPLNPDRLVTAHSGGVLSLWGGSRKLQSFRYSGPGHVVTLAFDDAGLTLFAGTRDGQIRVFETSDEALYPLFDSCIGEGQLSGMAFVPACNDLSARLLMISEDTSVKIVDCVRGPAAGGRISGFIPRHTVPLDSCSSLPIKCCFSSAGGGYLVAGTSTKEICIFPIAGGGQNEVQRLKHHNAPVSAVAVNLLNTLLVSADTLGRLVFWRRMSV